MERVAFLIDRTSERLSCMLNPERLVVRRTAGVQPRRSVGGVLTGAGLSDDPLFYTGGGATELNLDLLFDVSIGGSTINTEDVRELTAPLWALAENRLGGERYGEPPLARFVWGKSWNMPGVVVSVAERLEYFTPGGTPMRSWLRMCFRRVSQPSRGGASSVSAGSGSGVDRRKPRTGSDMELAHEVHGGSANRQESSQGSSERLDEIAHRYYGDASAWRAVAAYNSINDPTRIPAGTVLHIPPGSRVEDMK